MGGTHSANDQVVSERTSEVHYSLINASGTYMAARQNEVWGDVKEYIKTRVGLMNSQWYSDELWNTNTHLTAELAATEKRAKERFDREVLELSRKIGRWLADREKDWHKRFRASAKEVLDRDSSLSSYTSSDSGSQMSQQQQQAYPGFDKPLPNLPAGSSSYPTGDSYGGSSRTGGDKGKNNETQHHRNRRHGR